MRRISSILLCITVCTLISCSSGAKLAKVEDAPPFKCTTKVKTLNGTYTGTCKDGLAEGQGRAVGKNKTYVGIFHNGLPDGKGKMITRRNGKKKSKSGYWDNGTYAGKKKMDPYDVTSKRTVGRVRVRHLNNHDNRVEVRVDPGNSNITPTNIKNIQLQGNSGSLHNSTEFRGYKNIDFPFKGRVDFEVHQVQSGEPNQKGYVEFELNTKGSWLIEIDAM